MEAILLMNEDDMEVETGTRKEKSKSFIEIHYEDEMSDIEMQLEGK